jgi:hypothetical protein
MIRLTDLKNIGTIIKTKYGNNLFRMNFIFCIKKRFNSYFIFQEIQGMPIKRIVYHKSNNSVSFVASWAAWGNPFALVADANYEKVEGWKDLQDRTRPYNNYIEIDGGFNETMWTSINRKNKTEKEKKHKRKIDAFCEFRIDKIERAVFAEGVFELYSPTISMVGMTSRTKFPHLISDPVNESEETILLSPLPSPFPPPLPVPLSVNGNYPEDEEDDSSLITKVSWQGRSFNIQSFEEAGSESHSVTVPNQGHIQGGYDLVSYWDENENREINDLFDEEIGDIIHGHEQKDGIVDVGQRDVRLNLGE